MSLTSHSSFLVTATCPCSSSNCSTTKSGSWLSRKDTWSTGWAPWWTEAMSVIMRIWKSANKYKRVVALCDQIYCWVVLLRCSCCSARLNIPCPIVVCYWNPCWILVPSNLELLGGIHWDWIGPLNMLQLSLGSQYAFLEWWDPALSGVVSVIFLQQPQSNEHVIFIVVCNFGGW